MTDASRCDVPKEPDVPTPRTTPRAVILGAAMVAIALIAAGGFLLTRPADNDGFPPMTLIMTDASDFKWGTGQGVAEPTTVGGNAQHVTIEANGQPVTVKGSNNTVLINGDCPNINVSGARNFVQMETVGEITISGESNTVRWGAGQRGNDPTVSQSGDTNSVAHGEEE